MSRPGAVVLHADDNVAVLLRAVAAGERIALGGVGEGGALSALAALPIGHKLALRALPAGSEIRKYGEVIGRLTAAVEPGDHVHVHNIRSLRA
jgi:altronate hydrolase/altronate dehydratase small subunit